MIEVLKQALEALKDVGVLTDREWQAVHKNKVNELRQAIAELESQEPVAWMHIMDNTEGIKANGAGIVSITQKRKHPFGKAGIDFSKSYPVTSTPLYTHPPQHTWQGLTDEEVKHEWVVWRANLPRYAGFAKGIEAKLKQKNGYAEENT